MFLYKTQFMIENKQNSIESNAVKEQKYNFGKGEGGPGDYKYIKYNGF